MSKGTRLEGQAAIVTGGGRGIGRAIALGLAAEGAAVTVMARTAEQIEAVADEIDRLGGGGQAIVVDMMDGEAIKAAVAAAHAHHGRLDVLVNNVGGIVCERVEDLLPLTHDDAAWEASLFLNVSAMYYATRATLPHMVEADYGRVINIGSGYAKRGGGFLVYGTAKHAVVGFTRTLAGQVPTGITVNCLCPGWTNTALVDWDVIGLASGTSADSAKAAAEAECIQNRILEPLELVPMATLLAAPESAGMTGQVVSVDGGYRV